MILQYLDGVIALILLVAGAVTIAAARKRGQRDMESEALANAQAAMEIMKVQIQALKDNLESKTLEQQEMASQQQQMIARIDVLESLVSQKYDLSKIQEDLAYVKEKVSELA